MSLLDFIFPKRCVGCKKLGSYICTNCFAFLSFDAKSVCLVCQRRSIDGLTHPGCRGKYTIDGCFSAVPYNKTAKKLIYNFKYNPYLADLKKFLSDLLYESLIQNENFNRVIKSSHPAGDQPEVKKDWIFVPIPLYSSKLRFRGYNQSEILAGELSRRLNFTNSNILKRTKKTKTQVGLKLEQRRKNVKNAFEINSSLIINPSSFKKTGVFLVDDVVTTGSTLLEAANVLKRKGAGKVYGITLARD